MFGFVVVLQGCVLDIAAVGCFGEVANFLAYLGWWRVEGLDSEALDHICGEEARVDPTAGAQ